MIELLRVASLVAVVVFCIFRVSEVNWAKTWPPEVVGYLLAGIGAFWQILLLSSHYIWIISAQLQDQIADVIFYIGVGLILFAATCWRAKRRRAPRRSR